MMTTLARFDRGQPSTAALKVIADTVTTGRALDGLSIHDGRSVGVNLLTDYLLGGLDRLWWRAKVILESPEAFDDAEAALAAHAHAVALIDGSGIGPVEGHPAC